MLVLELVDSMLIRLASGCRLLDRDGVIGSSWVHRIDRGFGAAPGVEELLGGWPTGSHVEPGIASSARSVCCERNGYEAPGEMPPPGDDAAQPGTSIRRTIGHPPR
jgi:hypothetical protein